MSYRYNTTDIVVGVGLCAILFGALLLFMAANGSYQVTIPQPVSLEHPSDNSGMIWLQPALGQAIVDQALAERRINRAVTQSVSEWNRTTMAYHDLQSRSSGFLGSVLKQGQTTPVDHMARVQAVMGRAIVNFTKRGVGNGLLSAEQYDSPYNVRMIGVVEAYGQRLHEEFSSTWQTILGGRIVEAAQHDWFQAGAIQERLGTAVVQVAQVDMNAEQGRAVQQEQLASLIVAAVRNDRGAEHIVASTTIASSPNTNVVASTDPISWPEIPMGYLMLASTMLSIIFLTGLSMAAQSREARALAQMRRDADRWAFRMTV